MDNNLNESEIFKLFLKSCSHIEDYILGESKSGFRWSRCEGCKLTKIAWMTTPEHKRDLCFAVWHDDIIKKYDIDLELIYKAISKQMIPQDVRICIGDKEYNYQLVHE